MVCSLLICHLHWALCPQRFAGSARGIKLVPSEEGTSHTHMYIHIYNIPRYIYPEFCQQKLLKDKGRTPGRCRTSSYTCCKSRQPSFSRCLNKSLGVSSYIFLVTPAHVCQSILFLRTESMTHTVQRPP